MTGARSPSNRTSGRRPVPWENWYSRPDWRRLRKAVLAARPLCESCRLARSEHVDHVRAHRGNEALFLDPANLRAVCRSCHSSKTILRDGGFGRAPSDRPLAGTGADGRPLDPEHPWNRPPDRPDPDGPDGTESR